jgi:hypothetical protein
MAGCFVLPSKGPVSSRRIPRFLNNNVTNSQVLFHNGSLLHSKFNTQLLITVYNSSRILTQVQLLPGLEHNSQITLRNTLQLNTAGKYTSYLFAFQNTTDSLLRNLLPYILHCRIHSNAFVYIVGTAINPLLRNRTVTLLWKCNKLIVTQHTQQELLRYYGNLICHIAPSLRLLVPRSPQVRRRSAHMSHYHLCSNVALDLSVICLCNICV